MTITVELNASPALLEALRLLAGFANPVASFTPTAKSTCMAEAKQVKNAVEESKDAAETDRCTPLEATAPAPVVIAAPATATSTDTTKPVMPANLTVEYLRAATREKTESGKKAEVKALLSKYGSDSVTNLDAAHYAAYYAEVVAL